jgi:hypothetical protein
VYVSESVTADALATILKRWTAPLLEKLGLTDFEQLFAVITTDTCSVPLKVLKDMGVPWLTFKCICHVIQLLYSANLLPPLSTIAQRSIFDRYVANNHMTDASGKRGPTSEELASLPGCTDLRAIVTDVKTVVNKFAYSSKVARSYESEWANTYVGAQACKPLMPIMDVPTRWSSTFNLLVRFTQIWWVIQRMTAIQLAFDNESEWSVLRNRIVGHMENMKALLPLLEVFFIWTERFQAAEPTMHLVRGAVFVS